MIYFVTLPVLIIANGAIYPGTDSFASNSVGSDPSNWYVRESSNTDVMVESEYSNHSMVLSCKDASSSGSFTAINYFTAQNSGTVEFWFSPGGTSSSRFVSLQLRKDEIYLFGVVFCDNWVEANDGSVVKNVLTNFQTGTWYHFKFTFDCSASAYDGNGQYQYSVYVNDIKYGPYDFANNDNSADEFFIGSHWGGCSVNQKLYFDAIGYSWDTSYTVGDNLIPDGGTPPTLDPLLVLIIVVAVIAIPIVLIVLLIKKKPKKKKDKKVQMPGVTVPQQYVPTPQLYVPTQEVVQQVMQLEACPQCRKEINGSYATDFCIYCGANLKVSEKVDIDEEKVLKDKIGYIEYLILEEDTSKALDELGKFLEIAQKNNITKYVNWAMQKLDFFNKKVIKKTVMDLGTKYSRLEIIDITEKSGIKDENLVVDTVLEMIKNKEIYGEYFAGSKSIAFNLQANIEEIDKLMQAYEDWEKEKVDKKE